MFERDAQRAVGRTGQGGVLDRPAARRSGRRSRASGDTVSEACARPHAVRCEVAVSELLYDAPLAVPGRTIRARIGNAARALGHFALKLPSPAGHDSRYLHYVCPTGMIFIPCKDGISHNEAESITPADATWPARAYSQKPHSSSPTNEQGLTPLPNRCNVHHAFGMIAMFDLLDPQWRNRRWPGMHAREHWNRRLAHCGPLCRRRRSASRAARPSTPVT